MPLHGPQTNRGGSEREFRLPGAHSFGGVQDCWPRCGERLRRRIRRVGGNADSVIEGRLPCFHRTSAPNRCANGELLRRRPSGRRAAACGLWETAVSKGETGIGVLREFWTCEDATARWGRTRHAAASVSVSVCVRLVNSASAIRRRSRAGLLKPSRSRGGGDITTVSLRTAMSEHARDSGRRVLARGCGARLPRVYGRRLRRVRTSSTVAPIRTVLFCPVILAPRRRGNKGGGPISESEHPPTRGRSRPVLSKCRHPVGRPWDAGRIRPIGY